MDALKELEIYIPPEAVVKQVPLKNLPKSLQRRIHHFQPDISSNQANPAIWIFPVQLQKKGWRPQPGAGGGEAEAVPSQLVSQIRSLKAPLRMPFVTANSAAYKVLQGAVHEEQVRSSKRALHHGYQKAVVIYEGTIYLSIKIPNQGQKSKPVAQSAHSSTSNLSPSDKEKVRPGVSSTTTSGALQHDSQAQLGSDPHPQLEPMVVELSDDDQEPEPGRSQSLEQAHGRPEVDASEADPYQALEKEEKIAQMRAKLQKNKATVNKLLHKH